MCVRVGVMYACVMCACVACVCYVCVCVPCIHDQFPTRVRLCPYPRLPSLQAQELPNPKVSLHACDTEVAAGAMSGDATLSAKVDALNRGIATEGEDTGSYNCNTRTEGFCARAGGGGGTGAQTVCVNTVYVAGIGAGAGEEGWGGRDVSGSQQWCSCGRLRSSCLQSNDLRESSRVGGVAVGLMASHPQKFVPRIGLPDSPR